jgi:hypothetical protein
MGPLSFVPLVALGTAEEVELLGEAGEGQKFRTAFPLLDID